MDCCKEQHSILKMNTSQGGGCMLLHVDNVLFIMSADFMRKTVLPVLKQSFKLFVT